MSCEQVWDGVDFTPCFRDNYLANAGIALTGIAGSLLLLRKARRRLNPTPRRTAIADLVPPGGDGFARLEATVLIDSLADVILNETAGKEKTPPHLILGANYGATDESRPQQRGPLPPREAERVVNEFREDRPLPVQRSNLVFFWLSVGGTLAWLATELAALLLLNTADWRRLVYPAFMVVVAVVNGPLLWLMSAHLAPAFLLLRSAIISGDAIVSYLPTVYELVLYAVLISIPYYENLDNLLAGAVGHGGIGSGEGAPAHLEEHCSAFSRATYVWILPFLWKHYKIRLKAGDIPALREDDGAAASDGAFRAIQAKRDYQWEKKHRGDKRKRNLGIDLIHYFMPELITQGLLAILYTILQYLPPVGLRLLLQFIEERDVNPQPMHVAFLYIGMMAIGQSVGVTVSGQCLQRGRRIYIRMRGLMVEELLAKSLRRQDRAGATKDKDGEGKSSSDGRLNNLVGNDTMATAEIAAYAFFMVSCTAGMVVNLFLLYNTLGVASFAGIAVLAVLMPVQALIGKLYTTINKKLLAATDKRLEGVTEVISFIKLLKFNAWEERFYNKMMESRRAELKVLAQMFALIIFSQIATWATPLLVAGAAFGTHVLVLGGQLTADRAFASIVLFNMIRDPFALLVETVTRLLQAYTSCNRIQDFLDEPDTLKYSQLSTPGPSDPEIGFRDAILAHPGSEEPTDGEEENELFRLGELDLSFPAGQLSLVTGPVGSGKSTLVLSLLGETVLLKGKIYMPDDRANRELCPIDHATGLSNTVAYCAQTAWLVGATIRQNIVFGAAWDQKRYDDVIYACALARDLEIFDLGDSTEVGEKGTTCSGGQKARIALARALYSPAKTIILDDVLSAVDAHTARHLYNHVLQGPLMAGRTCILVTHAVGLCVPAAGFVVSLDAGRVVASGTPAELFASGALELEPATPSEDDAATATGSDQPATVVDNIDELDIDRDEAEAKKIHDAQEAAPGVAPKGAAGDKKLVKEESSQEGAVNAETYLLYARAFGSVPFWAMLTVAYLTTQALQVGTNAWIKKWSAAVSDRLWHGKEHSSVYYLTIYFAISAAYLLCMGIRLFLTFFGSLHASNKLYKSLLKRILGAQMRFFDSTPSGRIMNRLSKDMQSIDGQIGDIVGFFVTVCLSCIAILAVVTWTTPPFLFMLVGIVFLYWVVGVLYVTTNREIKRFDSTTRSPIFVSFSETITGMTTIRAYGDSARFMRKLITEIDNNNRCFWYLWQANRVLNNLSNFVGTLVTVSAAVLALTVPGITAGAAGLSISYALSFTESVLWVVRLYAAAEMAMNSVERVGEYLDLEVEEEVDNKGIEPPAYWPSKEGSVVVDQLTMKYAPQLDPVLRDVSFTIAPREKIGICGRTGSGKSTLALSFFRFLYQESGRILIDGLDISKISLHTLRERLTILPQEAELFSGTVRENMDPFNQHEDSDIWEALRQCGLTGRTPGHSRSASRAVSRVGSNVDLTEDGEVEERIMIRTLEDKVAAGGKNFSQGQRQLLALARGLLKLRTSSFLILDESTASLDSESDARFQSVLRSELTDTTMLVIAHRLKTVVGLDKILVLDHGKVLEFGTPWELMQVPNGSFHELCTQSGEEAQLLEIAKSLHDKKEAAARQ